MATEAGLLPTMDVSSLLDQQQQRQEQDNSTAAGIGALQDDPFLHELITSQQGVSIELICQSAVRTPSVLIRTHLHLRCHQDTYFTLVSLQFLAL